MTKYCRGMQLTQLLNDPQRTAATHLDGPVCILAGAGSGKTRVVTHRIAHLLLEHRVRPWTILAVTFTNKAAAEMKHRIEALVPDKGKDVQVGTFHGMAARYLRRYGDAVGVPRSFVIYDQDDAERLMKRVVVNELNWKKDLVRPLLHRVYDWEAEGLVPSAVPDAPWSDIEQKARQAYARYYERLAGMGAVDFGGLLVKLNDLLDLPAGEEVRRRARHVLVDEYQDTNRVQSDIVLKLAKSADSLCVVGDDDQAIYGWRGASAHNLKNFVDQLDGATLVRLEDNYRSTRYILDAANAVIGHNTARLGKTLRPTGDDGRPVRILKCRDDITEAKRVVSLIQERAQSGQSLEGIAVLYRTNALSRLFEDELRRAHLPYRLIGGVRFYDRKEVKDVLSTLRAALNPKSDVDTLRFLSAVPRGIGAKSLAKLQEIANTENLSVLEVMGEEALAAGAGLQKRAASKGAALAEQLFTFGDDIRPREGDDRPILDAKAALAKAIELSGVADRLEAEGTVEAEGRLENLSALLSAAAQFEQDAKAAGEPAHVVGFLEAASLLGGDDVGPDEEQSDEKITLMTLHAAKGLEFDVVFLIGLEEHSFPHARALAEDADPEQLEEERRLAYVGITRAKHHLVLSYAQRRMVQGAPRPRRASRFLEEIPADLATGDLVAPRGPGLMFADDEDMPLPRRITRRRRLPAHLLDEDLGPQDHLSRSFQQVKARLRGQGQSPDGVRVELDDQPRARDPARLEIGARVRHETFGDGVVVSLRGSGRLASAMVRFDGSEGTRVIIARHLEPSTEPVVVSFDEA